MSSAWATGWLAVLLVVPSALLPAPARACSCARLTDEEVFERTDEVFEGRVGPMREVVHATDDYAIHLTLLEVTVTRVWKGDPPDRLSVQIDVDSSCAVEPPRTGTLAIFYGRDLHACSRAFLSDTYAYAVELARLGPGTARAPLPSDPPPRRGSARTDPERPPVLRASAGCAHCAAIPARGSEGSALLLVLGGLLLLRRRARILAFALAAGAAPAHAQQRIAIGYAHTCMAHEGRAVCFGEDEHGGGVLPIDDVVEVGAGLFHACARTEGGAVWCWGANAHGQVGSPEEMRPYGAFLPPARVAIEGATQLSVGAMHACAIVAGGRALCWGGNHYGELGRDGEGGPEPAPLPVDDVRELATGPGSTCAVTERGAVRCFGRARIDVTASRALALGWRGACAIDRDGALACAPAELAGELRSVRLGTLHSVAIGPDHVCVAGTMGVTCSGPRWGIVPREELRADGDIIEELSAPTRDAAVRVLGRAVSELRLGDSHACVARDGGVWCWGYLAERRAGLGLGVRAVEGSPAVELEGAPSTHACRRHPDGSVSCGALGAWRAVEGVRGATAMAASARLGCAIVERGAVACWSPGGVAAPVRGIARARALSVGLEQACAIVARGVVRCWGANELGQARPVGAFFIEEEAVEIPEARGAVRLSARRSCATLEGGREVCWRGERAAPRAPRCAITGELARCEGRLVLVPRAVEVIEDEHGACVRNTAGAVSCVLRRSANYEVWPPRRVPLELWTGG